MNTQETSEYPSAIKQVLEEYFCLSHSPAEPHIETLLSTGDQHGVYLVL